MHQGVDHRLPQGGLGYSQSSARPAPRTTDLRAMFFRSASNVSRTITGIGPSATTLSTKRAPVSGSAPSTVG